MCAQAEEIAIKSKMSNLRNVSLELTHFFSKLPKLLPLSRIVPLLEQIWCMSA